MKRVDIFAPNVRHGGGKILLLQLVNSLIEEGLIGKVHASADLQKELSHSSDIIYYSNSIFSKLKSEINIIKKPIKGSTVLFFGNLPPIKKLNAKSILYLHNILLIKKNIDYKFALKTKIRLILERMYLWLFIKNVDEIYVQTPVMLEELKRFKKGLNIKIKPFMNLNLIHNKNKHSKEKYDFIYPSYGYPYKNHKLIIKSWIELAQCNHYPSLCLMLDKNLDNSLYLHIEKFRKKFNLNIEVVFNIPNEQIADYYNTSTALIWPSLEESFGMPIIEAVHLGLQILATDQKYITDMIEGAYIFDTNNSTSMKDSVIKLLNDKELNKSIYPKLKLHIPSSNDFIKSM